MSCVRSWLGVLENKYDWAGPMCHVSDCGWVYWRIRMSARDILVTSREAGELSFIWLKLKLM